MPLVAITHAGEGLEEAIALSLLGMLRNNDISPDVLCGAVVILWQKKIANLAPEEWEKQTNMKGATEIKKCAILIFGTKN